MTPLLEDLRREIARVARRRRPVPERRFHRHGDYRVYGLTTPELRKVLRAFRVRLMELTLEQRLALARELVAQHVGELGHAAITVVALSVEALRPRHLALLDGLVGHFKSWSQVDHFCSAVMKPLLSAHRRESLNLAKKWNVSPNRFKRRASVVMFTREVGASGELTTQVLRLCENLIWDPEDIVRKGVGWALKDNLRSGPERVLPYIKDLRRRGVCSTITLYAIRDLGASERQKILRLRPRSRR